MQHSDEDSNQQSNSTKLTKIKQAFKDACMSYGIRRSYCQLFLSSFAVIKVRNGEQKQKIISYGVADEINLLKKGESRAQKIEQLLQEREEILRLLRLQLMVRKNQRLLKIRQCCQYLQHFRMYNLLILEHLQQLRNDRMVGDNHYQNQIITGLLFDSDFIRLSQLRKYIEFSKRYDPLFIIPLKKFWNLERASDYNKREIIDLFTMSQQQRERYERSDQFLRQFLKKHEHKLKKRQEQIIYEIQKTNKDNSLVLSKSKSSQGQTLPKFILPAITPHAIQNKNGNNIYDIIKIHQERQRNLRNIELKRMKDLKAKRRSTTQANEYSKIPIDLSLQHLRGQQKIAKRKAYLLDQYNKDEPQSEYKRNKKAKKIFFRNQTLTLPAKGTLIQQRLPKQSERSKIKLSQTGYNQILQIIKQKSQINIPKQQTKQQKQQQNGNEDQSQYEISKHRSNKYRKNKIIVRSQQSKLKQTVSHGHWTKESNQKLIDEGIIRPNISNFNSIEPEQRQRMLNDKVNQIERVSGFKSRIKQSEKPFYKPQLQKFNNPLQILQNIRGKRQEIQLKLSQKKKISVGTQQNNLHKQSDSKRTSRNRVSFQHKESPKKLQNLQIQSNFNETLNRQLLETKKQSIGGSNVPMMKRIKKNLGFISSNVNYSFGTQSFGNKQHTFVTPSPQPKTSPMKNRIVSQINQFICIPQTHPDRNAVNPVLNIRQVTIPTQTQKFAKQVKPSKVLNNQSNDSGKNMGLLSVQLNKKDISNSFCQTDQVRNNTILPIQNANIKFEQSNTQYMKNNSVDNKSHSLTNPIFSNDAALSNQKNKQLNNNISLADKKGKRQINIFDQTLKLQQHNISLLNQSLKQQKQSIKPPDEQKIHLNLTKQQQSILQRCTFQSKSHLQQQLQLKIKKYSRSRSQKIIQYTKKHYFMNRHIILSTCSYNNEVISYSLSSPHLTQEHRYVFIIYLEVIKEEFHNLLSKFLATFVKYLFFNDPTDYVIYLQIKDIFYKKYVQCFESINNYAGAIKTPIKSPYFDEQSYMFQRKDIKCNKIQDYTTIFNTLTLFIANRQSKAPLQSLKINQLYISSSYLNFIQKSIKQNQGKLFPKLKDLQKYLQSQSFPTFKQKTLQQGIILHQNLLQDCLTKIRFYVYSNFCYITIQPPYTLFYQGKQVNFVLIATIIKNRYFVLADRIYEESENIDIYKQMKNELFGKKAKDLFYSEKSKGKIVSCPLFQKVVEFSLSEDVYGIVSFSLNWKDYLKGTRYFREDANNFELIGPFLCGYLQLDEEGRIHHLYSTIINQENLQK